MNTYTLEQQKGQSRMDNPEKLATLGTQDTRRRQTKKTIIHKIYNDINLTLNYDEIKFMFDVMTRIKTIIYQV